MNSGRPIGVVQKGSSNEGSSNSDHEQWSSNSDHEQWSVNSGRQQWSSNRGRQTMGRQIVSVNSGRPTVASSSRLTAHDLQLRKAISPSFELRFGCSWTLWKAH